MSENQERMTQWQSDNSYSNLLRIKDYNIKSADRMCKWKKIRNIKGREMTLNNIEVYTSRRKSVL